MSKKFTRHEVIKLLAEIKYMVSRQSDYRDSTIELLTNLIDYLLKGTIIIDKDLLKEALYIKEVKHTISNPLDTVKYITKLQMNQTIELSKETIDILKVDYANLESTLKSAFVKNMESRLTNK